MPLEDFLKSQRKRINPFKGLIIDVNTWADAHNYHRDQQRLHAIATHQHGIAVGLEVVAWDPPDSSVVIYPGIAVDHEGNTIVVSETQRFYIKTQESGPAYIILEYRELPHEMIQSLDGEKTEPLYILEAYRIEELRQRPTGPYVELARIVVEGKDVAIEDARDPFNPGPNEIDTRYRQIVGPKSHGMITLGLVDFAGSVHHQQGVSNLAQFINQGTDYRANFMGSVGLDEEIRYCDLLCMPGSNELVLTEDQEKVLLNFLNRGGVLLGEVCHDKGQEVQAFNQAFGNLAKKLGRNMRRVERGHPLLKVHHLFAAAPDGVNGAAILLEDQGMLYSDGDFGCVWAGGSEDKPLPRDVIRAAVELGVNIAIYAHQRTSYHALKIFAK